MAALTEGPNMEATVPTGMCGSPKKCRDCPSDFLCFLKAKKEQEVINARREGREPDFADIGWRAVPVPD